MSLEVSQPKTASNSHPQIEKITSLLQNYSSKLSFKHKLLLTTILKKRKASVTLISIYYKLKLLRDKEREKEKEKELLDTIINQRKEAINKLINWYKITSYQKKVRAILLKMEKCYTIESSIVDVKDFYLQLIELDSPPKKYKAEKCPILNRTAFYIPRSDIHSLIVKVHFIANGVMILDPKFSTGSDDDYNFYNQINFKKIIKAENDEKEERKKMISCMCNTATSSVGFKNLKSISSADLHKLNHGLSKYNKKFQSMAVLNIQVKPILKQRPAKRVASNRKIAFGNVDYSY